jgi:hypothetical protein
MAPEQTGRMNRSIDSRSDSTRSESPVAPADRVPDPVSPIIMKLLAKTAEDRYQTAAGLERDLDRMLGAAPD